MTREDKELLLKDLCARQPYSIYADIWYEDGIVLDCTFVNTHVLCHLIKNEIKVIKPYLRPLSLMTEEEMDMVEEIMQVDTNNSVIFDFMANGDIAFQKANISIDRFGLLIDYFNKQMLDWRGLIDKGLAFAVTEENNPYKE